MSAINDLQHVIEEHGNKISSLQNRLAKQLETENYRTNFSYSQLLLIIFAIGVLQTISLYCR